MSDRLKNALDEEAIRITRRYFLGRGAGFGLGAMALGNIYGGKSADKSPNPAPSLS